MSGADRQQCPKANGSQTADSCFHGQRGWFGKTHSPEASITSTDLSKYRQPTGGHERGVLCLTLQIAPVAHWSLSALDLDGNAGLFASLEI